MKELPRQADKNTERERGNIKKFVTGSKKRKCMTGKEEGDDR